MRLALILVALSLGQDDKGESLYKFKTGTFWSYEIKAPEGKGPGLVKMEMKAAGEVDGKTEVETNQFMASGQSHKEKLRWFVKDGVLTWSEVRGEKEKDPVQFLRIGAKKGDTWEWAGMEGRKAKGTYLGLEELKVPAGTYKDVHHCRLEMEEHGDSMAMDVYLVAGVGMLKMSAKMGEEMMSFELKEFKPEK